jgi:hypothetical protein
VLVDQELAVVFIVQFGDGGHGRVSFMANLPHMARQGGASKAAQGRTGNNPQPF